MIAGYILVMVTILSTGEVTGQALDYFDRVDSKEFDLNSYKDEIIIRCAEELIGRNSETP